MRNVGSEHGDAVEKVACAINTGFVSVWTSFMVTQSKRSRVQSTLGLCLFGPPFVHVLFHCGLYGLIGRCQL